MKKRPKRFAFKHLVSALLFVGFSVFVLYNLRHNPHFWEASATNCITIGVAVIVSYYLVQRQNNIRKQKDIILELILKLQTQISAPEAYNFSGQSSDEIMMRKRDFSNRINIISAHKTAFHIEDDVDFVIAHFQEYESLIGNHIDNLEYLVQSSRELQRPLSLIENKLYDIALNLYK